MALPAPTLGVAAGASTTFDVNVVIPDGSAAGTLNSSTVTVTSQGDPTLSATVTLTTTASGIDVVFVDGFDGIPG